MISIKVAVLNKLNAPLEVIDDVEVPILNRLGACKNQIFLLMLKSVDGNKISNVKI